MKFNLHKHCPVPVERQIYPLILAFSVTVHKTQGSIYSHVIGDLTIANNSGAPQGLASTLLSRATAREMPHPTKVNKEALQ